ncbi:GNAT family N-acetyltransferase [Flavobacterium sp. SUN052]|uniref:GNAT family N-acetyltransferase n=1 Tax=Flavobacterium sp. SUN052 TaxID=3002441 RepID=UPI00237DC5F4|nr:GNAT family N-acetyltransferase [Flavobacterium sp. SUN052]MEC4005405.1 GNAT family N-acetyltransferase [Flavobacterium sp. SUN052]
MKQFQVRLYTPQDFEIWNAFVSVAKNATFLFHRDFMSYHSDRFQDYSLLVFDDEKLVAIVPANKVENVVYSHQGLTYGGLVLEEKAKLNNVILMFKSILNFLNENAVNRLIIKTIPSFYCTNFSDELEYCMFLTQAKLTRSDSLSVIDLTKPYFVLKTRKESINRGKKNGLIIKEETNFDLFWNEILIPNLDNKHQVSPVHSAAEMTLLQSRFPKNIRHFNVYNNDKIVAGTTVFVNNHVAHPQYISGNAQKNELGSLDFLYHYLITDIFKDKAIFDFNNSNEDFGTKINQGLLFWKESFGAKTVVQNFYEVETKNSKLLESVLI